CLLVLQCRIGIRDNAGAGIDECTLPLHDYRADDNAGIQVSIVSEVSDRPGIEPALFGFQLADNLHRANFWSARYRARGKRGNKQIKGGFAGGKPAPNIGDDVDNMRVTLYGHQFVDFDTANLSDAPNVVAPQIDQHDVFCPFFRIGEQVGFKRSFFFRRGPAAPCAGDGTELNSIAGEPDHRFRRGADYPKVVQFEIEHIRGRVDKAERSIDFKRVGRGLSLESLAEHHLDDVARLDIVFSFDYCFFESIGRKIRTKLSLSAPLVEIAWFDSPRFFLQRRDDLANSRSGLVIGLAEIGFLIDTNIIDDFNCVFQVVERNQCLHEEKEDLRHFQGIFLAIWDFMKLLDGVVRDVTKSAAKKGRHSGHGDRLAAAKQLFEQFERGVGYYGLRCAIADDFDLISASPKN